MGRGDPSFLQGGGGGDPLPPLLQWGEEALPRRTHSMPVRLLSPWCKPALLLSPLLLVVASPGRSGIQGGGR